MGTRVNCNKTCVGRDDAAKHRQKPDRSNDEHARTLVVPVGDRTSALCTARETLVRTSRLTAAAAAAAAVVTTTLDIMAT